MEAKISHSGLLARSPEGHAARGMQIKGNEDLWVEIQANTFRNWVNENLPASMRVADLSEDLCSGVRLCALVEALQGRPIKPSWNKRPGNQHHYLENVTAALNAIEQDGVKLVNIGNVDIVKGNLKLILGLIWSLIVRYQIGRSKFPPRKLMLAWLQAVLPECKVKNLTTDWNSGILLSALVDYCQPGLCPHWKSLNKNDSVENCRKSMSIAQKELGIPAVLEPEYLASPWLDELSGMTYLSYFMKPGSPGFHATLRWVNSRLNRPVKNFTSDWNDGSAICEVIKSLGGSAPAPEKLRSDPSHWEDNLNQALSAGKRLGVQPILQAKDMADKNVEHLGVMAYAAHFQWIPERPPIHDMIVVRLESTSGRVYEPTYFSIELLDRELSYNALSAEIRAPDNKTHSTKLKNGNGTYIPHKIGMHEIIVNYNSEEVSSAHYFRVLPPMVEVAPPGMAPCALGSIVQVLVNATGAPKTEDIKVTAYSPHDRPLRCPLTSEDDTNTASFKPDEPGEWRIEITYQGKQIQGGPFTCSVFDPNGVHLQGIEGALPLIPHAIDIDTSAVGVPGELHADVVHDKRSIHTRIERVGKTGFDYRLHFTPKVAGRHRVYVYFNGYDVKGSPFMMRVGTQKGKKSSSSSPINSSAYRQTPSPGVNHSSSRLNTPSPNLHTSSYLSPNSFNSNKTQTTSYNRQSASPSFGESKYNSSDSFKMTNESKFQSSNTYSSEKRMSSSSPSFMDRTRQTSPGLVDRTRQGSPGLLDRTRQGSPGYDRNRTSSPSLLERARQTSPGFDRNRTSSPSLFDRTRQTSPGFDLNRSSPSNRQTSPGFRVNSPNLDKTSFGSTEHKTERRIYESASPSFTKQEFQDFDKSFNQESSYTSKVQSMRITDSRSPTFGASPRIDKHESRTYSYDANDGVDTSPIIKVSAMHDRAARRDSWDAIAKTKNILSHRSLESVANLADSQLDAEMRSELSHKYSSEEHSNYVTRDQNYSQTQHQGERSTNYQSLLQSSTRPTGKGGATAGKGGATAVKVQPVPDGALGQPVEFEIDGSGAGSGDLEILVEGGRVTSSVRSLGGQRFKAAFTPHQALPHRVDIRFNGDTVPGSPWHVNIMSGSSSSVLGESTRLVPANQAAVFEIITSTSLSTDELTVHVVAPSKRIVPSRVLPGSRSGIQQVEFVPTEVGTHVVEVAISGEKLSSGPLIAKVYDAGLIQVADVSGGVVGQPVQFRVDASQAGEGQLEISINEGEVPNHVQVVGGGRCLVSFTPDQAKPHLIDIKFNGETVRGCPFVCSVADTSRVTLNLAHLELIPVNQSSSFHMGVAGGGAAELAVAVRGPAGELPVKVTGDIHAGFTAEFTPSQVGAHQISVDYNSRPVQGTPFVAKAFDATRVTVGTVARGTVGRPVTFSVDASEAGEGNLEITISARGLNIPTQVHPQGNARFAVSFVPAEACDHVVNVAFNKRPVVGCPLIVGVGGGGAGPSVTLPGPGPVHRASTLLINHPGRLEDIEVNVEGPGGQAVPTQVQALGNAQFRAEFVPRAVGEHRISVSVSGSPTAGSPYSAKVYDVQAIKVKESPTGVVGKPVTFLVETSQAGPGNLEVTVNGGRVPTSAQAQGAHTYAISFTPREATPHTVDLRFNGQDVPGSPFKCTVAPAARIVAPETLDKVSVGRICQFAVESPTAPTVEVLGPARRSLQVQVTPQIANPGKFDVAFTPLNVGDHSVEVRLGVGGGHVEGSPFLIKAYDANRVSVTDITDGTVGKPVSFSINASQAGAGNLEIIVAVNGRNVPNFVQSEGNARFKVNFKPTEAATHSLSVRFNGQAVPGSPFNCKVSPGNTQPRLPVSGNGIELAAVGVPAEIKLEGITDGEPQLIVTSPTGKILPVKQSTHAETLVAHFTPEHVGRHSIAILIADQHVIGSPFSCNVYDVSKVIVSGLPGRNDGLSRSMSDLSLREHGPAEVGKAVTFSVDAAQAGEGTLELVVSTQHTTVKAEVVACARGLYDVTFVPQTTEDHFVNITFNDMPVVGSPFLCPVTEATQFIQIGSTATIDLPSDNHHLEITDPNGQNLTYSLKNSKAEFPASQIGTYRVHIMRGNEIIAARTTHVFDSSKIEVTSAPEAICHRPAVIGVNLKHAGPGKLSAAVRVGNRDIAHSVRQNTSNPGLWEVVFHPVNAAPHRITLSFNGVPKSGVLEVPVRAPGTEPWASGLGLYQARVGKVTAFSLDTLGRPAREFDVVVSGPTGSALPVRCYQTKTGRLQAEFTAQDVGAHRVEVLHQAKPLAGSPFTCQAFDAELVRLSDINRDQNNVGERITFTLNAREAGLAELEIAATNPLGQTLPLQIIAIDEFTQQISFLPTVPGHYNLTLAYGGNPVQGSPVGFAVGSVGPQPPPRAVGPGLESAQVGEKTSFTVSSIIQPRIQIEAAEGSIETHMQSPKPGEYTITYTPRWVGTYDIVIVCGPQQLAGSPFQPTIVDPTAVRIIGGWSQYIDETNRLKLPCKISFDVTNAGPGLLECTIAGRRITSEKVGGRTRLDLSAEGLSAGEHDLTISFGGITLPECPKSLISLGDQVILTGRGLAQAQCGEAAQFNIDGSRAGHGNPEVTLYAAETNLPIPVMLSLAGDKMWRAQYTILAPGTYFLSVLWAGRPVKGCPLTVDARGGADATKVLCSGEGLRQGVVGREIRSWIDTRRAGPGELTAHCTGPRKVAYCELYDHGDATFTLNVKPQEAGRHALTIKYAGQHVSGSPFVLRVAGAPDASKVRVYGPGIEHGVLATFQSRFICDTRGAGAGQLTVRVRGPKGAFRVEMQRESQKDRTILCKYDPTEPGDYRVEVKWAGELVPGSPFPVMIFDTQEELRRYLNSL